MKEKALYYPYINLPKKDWTYKTLLYWDELTTIVPENFYKDPESIFEPFMLDLVKSELVTQVYPNDYIHKIKNLDDIFSKYIENKYLKHNYKTKTFNMIHMDKMNIPLRNYLLKRNLAYEIKNNGNGWLMIDQTISDDYMTLLSNVISKFNKSIPVSDQLKHATPFDRNKSFYKHEQIGIRNHILDNILPIPSKDVSLNKLLYFKEEKGSQLIKFRKYIEELSFKISREKNVEIQKQLIESSITDIKNKSKDIEEDMKSIFDLSNISYGNILIIFGNVLTISNPELTPDKIITSIGEITKEIGDILKEQKKRSQEAESSPFAYIVNARRKLEK